MDAIRSKIERKQTGSFYSPSVLARFIASKMSELVSLKSGDVCVLDPAVGNGELLTAWLNARSNFNDTFVGVDIEEEAIQQAKSRFSKSANYFITNALSPFGKLDEGWSSIRKSTGIDGFDVIISNPPWGADIDLTSVDISSFVTAKGQYDIYDLFIELSINLLKEGGVYGFILPDSVYRQEHSFVRKMLLTQTNIKYIIKVGEFFFNQVNTPVSLIIGVKGFERGNVVSCLNLSNTESKRILKNDVSLNEISNLRSHSCRQQSFIDDGYTFSIDINDSDLHLIEMLEDMPKLGSIATSHRGVELSKKGNVVQCHACKLWFPLPKVGGSILCPHCSNSIDLTRAKQDTIIIPFSDKKPLGGKDKIFVAGEDMGRYFFKADRFINIDYEGINYKDLNLYKGPKILVRKTGVGITAVLDYADNLVNQVVYMIKNKIGELENLPIEFTIALLNSRLITYYIIKKFGSTKWCTHPYLTQKMILSLPIPNIRYFKNKDWEMISQIKTIVSDLYAANVNSVPIEIDVELERLIFSLFRLKSQHFVKVMESIREVEQLIPFKRLMNIPKELWATVI